MPSLTLKRERFTFGALRSLKIQIDEQTVVRLSFGEERTIELPAGSYCLVARMDWCGSTPLLVTLTGDDHKYVFVDCNLPQGILSVFLPPFKAFVIKENAAHALPLMGERS